MKELREFVSEMQALVPQAADIPILKTNLTKSSRMASMTTIDNKTGKQKELYLRELQKDDKTGLNTRLIKRTL